VVQASSLRLNADEVFIAHITPAGQTARLADLLKQWRTPFLPER